MFLPIGPENTILRRKPKVTLGIMAGLFGLYLLYLISPITGAGMASVELALDYRAHHP